jgi:Flp pilus assembly protein TadD
MSIERARLLISQRRYEMAESELRTLLAQEPQNVLGHYLLSIVLIQLERWREAEAAAHATIALVPDQSLGHFALARAYYLQDKNQEAEQAIREALRIDPNDASAWAILAGIYADAHNWTEALRYAEQGLSLEPEHEELANLRALMLNKLRRPMDTAAAIQASLYRNPDNARTHATQGWVQLETGKPYEAMDHFREALRLDPTLNWAREGIVEAMKARNPLYRWLLAYFFWMSRLDGRTRNLVIFGGFFGFRFVRAIARTNPLLETLFFPVVVLYLLFVYFTWTGDTIFNLILRLDAFGRLALSEEETRVSNYVGALLGIALCAIVAGLLLATPDAFMVAGMAAVYVIPVAATFRRPPKRRRFFLLYTLTLLVVALLGLASLVLDWGVTGFFLTIFFLGTVAFTWIATFRK